MKYQKGMDDPRYRPFRCKPKDAERTVEAGGLVIVMDTSGVKRVLRRPQRAIRRR